VARADNYRYPCTSAYFEVISNSCLGVGAGALAEGGMRLRNPLCVITEDNHVAGEGGIMPARKGSCGDTTVSHCSAATVSTD